MTHKLSILSKDENLNLANIVFEEPHYIKKADMNATFLERIWPQCASLKLPTGNRKTIRNMIQYVSYAMKYIPRFAISILGLKQE